jgi:hypothetical protein
MDASMLSPWSTRWATKVITDASAPTCLQTSSSVVWIKRASVSLCFPFAVLEILFRTQMQSQQWYSLETVTYGIADFANFSRGAMQTSCSLSSAPVLMKSWMAASLKPLKEDLFVVRSTWTRSWSYLVKTTTMGTLTCVSCDLCGAVAIH